MGPLIPYLGLLVTSPLSFKARVGNCIRTWQRRTCYGFPEIKIHIFLLGKFFSFKVKVIVIISCEHKPADKKFSWFHAVLLKNLAKLYVGTPTTKPPPPPFGAPDLGIPKSITAYCCSSVNIPNSASILKPETRSSRKYSLSLAAFVTVDIKHHCCHYWHQLQLYAFPFAPRFWFLHSSWRGLFVSIYSSLIWISPYHISAQRIAVLVLKASVNVVNGKMYMVA